METKKFLGYEGLQTYDDNIKAYVDELLSNKKGNDFVVTITSTTTDGTTTFTSDKTATEIYEAYNNGRYIYAVDAYSEIYALTQCTKSFSNFEKFATSAKLSELFLITDSKTVRVSNTFYTKTEVDTIVEELEAQLDEKVNAEHNHDDLYYTISQIDGMEFISTDDIDTICGGVTEEGLPSSDIDELMAQLR